MIGMSQHVQDSSNALPGLALGEAHSARPNSEPGGDETIPERILGNWRMTSWQIQDLASGETRDALGPNPQGYITNTRDSRVMVLVRKADRIRPAAVVATAEEQMAPY